MRADAFVRVDTLMIMGIGLVAFIFDSIGGVLFAKFINLFIKNKINPMIGAAGISAFPMSARVVQKMASEEEKGNIIPVSYTHLHRDAEKRGAGKKPPVLWNGYPVRAISGSGADMIERIDAGGFYIWG